MLALPRCISLSIFFHILHSLHPCNPEGIYRALGTAVSCMSERARRRVHLTIEATALYQGVHEAKVACLVLSAYILTVLQVDLHVTHHLLAKDIPKFG